MVKTLKAAWLGCFGLGPPLAAAGSCLSAALGRKDDGNGWFWLVAWQHPGGGFLVGKTLLCKVKEWGGLGVGSFFFGFLWFGFVLDGFVFVWGGFYEANIRNLQY